MEKLRNRGPRAVGKFPASASVKVRAGMAGVLSFLSFGCGGSDAPGALGELGNASLGYRCTNTGDLRCSELDEIDEFELGADLGTSDSIPSAVAVGARFGIRYLGDNEGETDLSVVVDSVSPDDRVAPNVYSISQPSEAAFIAVDGDRNVVDFLVMTALEATELGIWHDQDEVRTLRIDVGESVEVTVAPRSEGGTFLAGALPYDWETLDDGVASIGELGSSADDDEVNNEGDIEILGVAEGTTTVRVRSGDLEAVVEVEVNP